MNTQASDYDSDLLTSLTQVLVSSFGVMVYSRDSCEGLLAFVERAGSVIRMPRRSILRFPGGMIL
jgi:hypothetical protein